MLTRASHKIKPTTQPHVHTFLKGERDGRESKQAQQLLQQIWNCSLEKYSRFPEAEKSSITNEKNKEGAGKKKKKSRLS